MTDKLPHTQFTPDTNIIPLPHVRPIQVPPVQYEQLQRDIENVVVAGYECGRAMRDLATQFSMACEAVASAMQSLAMALAGVPGSPPTDLPIEDRVFLAAIQANKQRNTDPARRPPGYRRTA